MNIDFILSEVNYNPDKVYTHILIETIFKVDIENRDPLWDYLVEDKVKK